VTESKSPQVFSEADFSGLVLPAGAKMSTEPGEQPGTIATVNIDLVGYSVSITPADAGRLDCLFDSGLVKYHGKYSSIEEALKSAHRWFSNPPSQDPSDPSP